MLFVICLFWTLDTNFYIQENFEVLLWLCWVLNSEYEISSSQLQYPKLNYDYIKCICTYNAITMKETV